MFVAGILETAEHVSIQDYAIRRFVQACTEQGTEFTEMSQFAANDYLIHRDGRLLGIVEVKSRSWARVPQFILKKEKYDALVTLSELTYAPKTIVLHALDNGHGELWVSYIKNRSNPSLELRDLILQEPLPTSNGRAEVSDFKPVYHLKHGIDAFKVLDAE